MSVSVRSTAPQATTPPANAIPMMAQVYVRLRHRLREAEMQLQDWRAEESPRATEAAPPADAAERVMLEGRISILRDMVERAHVVPIGSGALVGSAVYVRSDEDEPLQRYEIVLSTEADPSAGKVSFDSPIGAALLGREVGDVATVVLPRGNRELRIMVIKHD